MQLASRLNITSRKTSTTYSKNCNASSSSEASTLPTRATVHRASHHPASPSSASYRSRFSASSRSKVCASPESHASCISQQADGRIDVADVYHIQGTILCFLISRSDETTLADPYCCPRSSAVARIIISRLSSHSSGSRLTTFSVRSRSKTFCALIDRRICFNGTGFRLCLRWRSQASTSTIVGTASQLPAPGLSIILFAD